MGRFWRGFSFIAECGRVHAMKRCTWALLLVTVFACDSSSSTPFESPDTATPGSVTSEPMPSNGNTSERAERTTDGENTRHPTSSATADDISATSNAAASGTSAHDGDTAAADGSGTGPDIGDACEPSPDDSSCESCVKVNCCNEARACLLEVGCNCFQECTNATPGASLEEANMCAAMCGVGLDEGAVGPVVQCSTNNCALACIFG